MLRNLPRMVIIRPIFHMRSDLHNTEAARFPTRGPNKLGSVIGLDTRGKKSLKMMLNYKEDWHCRVKYLTGVYKLMIIPSVRWLDRVQSALITRGVYVPRTYSKPICKRVDAVTAITKTNSLMYTVRLGIWWNAKSSFTGSDTRNAARLWGILSAVLNNSYLRQILDSLGKFERNMLDSVLRIGSTDAPAPLYQQAQRWLVQADLKQSLNMLSTIWKLYQIKVWI